MTNTFDEETEYTLDDIDGWATFGKSSHTDAEIQIQPQESFDSTMKALVSFFVKNGWRLADRSNPALDGGYVTLTKKDARITVQPGYSDGWIQIVGERGVREGYSDGKSGLKSDKDFRDQLYGRGSGTFKFRPRSPLLKGPKLSVPKKQVTPTFSDHDDFGDQPIVQYCVIDVASGEMIESFFDELEAQTMVDRLRAAGRQVELDPIYENAAGGAVGAGAIAGRRGRMNIGSRKHAKKSKIRKVTEGTPGMEATDDAITELETWMAGIDAEHTYFYHDFPGDYDDVTAVANWIEQTIGGEFQDTSNDDLEDVTTMHLEHDGNGYTYVVELDHRHDHVSIEINATPHQVTESGRFFKVGQASTKMVNRDLEGNGLKARYNRRVKQGSLGTLGRGPVNKRRGTRRAEWQGDLSGGISESTKNKMKEFFAARQKLNEGYIGKKGDRVSIDKTPDGKHFILVNVDTFDVIERSFKTMDAACRHVEANELTIVEPDAARGSAYGLSESKGTHMMKILDKGPFEDCEVEVSGHKGTCRVQEGFTLDGAVATTASSTRSQAVKREGKPVLKGDGWAYMFELGDNRQVIVTAV